MKYNTLPSAKSARDRAFETNDNCFMIVNKDGFFWVLTRREAAQLEKQGYEVY